MSLVIVILTANVNVKVYPMKEATVPTDISPLKKKEFGI